jgi:hypothetical protein
MTSRGGNSPPLQGIVQPVATEYTDWANDEPVEAVVAYFKALQWKLSGELAEITKINN